MTGTMAINELIVANIAIVDGCTEIDSLVLWLEDQTICPES